MNKWMMVFSILFALPASAAAPASAGLPADAQVVASAERFIADHCGWEHADFGLVLTSSSDEARRYDQNLFDHVYTMEYGTRSSHSGSVYSNALVLLGQLNSDETEIRWTVAMDAYGICRND